LNVNGKFSLYYATRKIFDKKSRCNTEFKKTIVGVRKVLIVIKPLDVNDAAIVYLQGQRLALDEQLANQIKVVAFNFSEDNLKLTLADIKPEQSCLLVKINGTSQFKQHIMEMGLTRGTLLKVIRLAPLGDPIELRVRGYKLTLRKQDASQIYVQEMNL
jgi:ferrous iron transport protein A